MKLVILILMFLNMAWSGEFSTQITKTENYRAIVLSQGFNIFENYDFESVFNYECNELRMCYLGEAQEARRLLLDNAHQFRSCPFFLKDAVIRGRNIELIFEDHENQETIVGLTSFVISVCQ